MDDHGGLEDILSRARRLALSYDKCRELIEQKKGELKTDSYVMRVHSVRVMRGWLEVVLVVSFRDGSVIQVKLDLERKRVIWVKNYLDTSQSRD